MITEYLTGTAIAIGALALPILLPNKTLYTWTRKTIGKFISALTIKTKDSPLKGLMAWGINSIATVASAISDEVRGVPAIENGGVKPVDQIEAGGEH